MAALNTTYDKSGLSGLPPMTEQEELELLAAAEEQARRDEEKKRELLADLAKTVEGKFEQRRKNRSTKERQWAESLRLYYGSAANTGKEASTSDAPFAGDTISQRPDYNIVRTKCDIVIAQLISMQFAGGDRNWDLTPDLGTDSATAQKMEDTISSQLTECKYAKQSRKAIEDRVIYGSAIMKGPVNTNRTHIKYASTADGVWQGQLASNKAPSYVRVNPWYAFPDDSTNDACFMEDFLEIHPMTRGELVKYTKHDGFMQDSVLELLKEDPQDYAVSVFEQLTGAAQSSISRIKNKYIVIEYHGPVTSEQLDALNIVPAYESPDGKTYYGEVWVCQGHVLRVELSNIENFEIPYTLCPYKEDPTSVLGIGMPMLVKDQQRVVTQAWHMILDNTSASSGPQVVIQRELIEPANGEWELRPRKQWFMNDVSARIADAFQFFVVPNVTPQIMDVLNAAKMFAEEESGVPMLLSSGIGSPKVGTDSATGIGMLQQASTILSDLANEAWDDLMTDKHICRMIAWNIQYNPDNSIKGNFKVDVKASSDYRNKQLYIRDMEKLSLEASQNQEMGKHVDMNELTRARLSMMHLPSQGIVRSPEQVAEMEQAAAQGGEPNPDVLKYNLEVERISIEKDRLLLEAQKLEFERTQAQRREEMEFEERRGNTYARIAEAEAQVIASQNDKDVAVMALASKDEQFRNKLALTAEIATQRNETTAYLKGLEDNRKARDQLLYDKEMNIKLKMGSGV